MAEIEYIKLEINIPKVTYQLIKDKMYLTVDEDIICKAVRNGTECKSVLDKIRAEIEEEYGDYDICEWFEDYDYEENNISDYRQVGSVSDILSIIDKYREDK